MNFCFASVQNWLTVSFLAYIMQSRLVLYRKTRHLLSDYSQLTGKTGGTVEVGTG